MGTKTRGWRLAAGNTVEQRETGDRMISGGPVFRSRVSAVGNLVQVLWFRYRSQA